jgi:hypothetical protein
MSMKSSPCSAIMSISYDFVRVANDPISRLWWDGALSAIKTFFTLDATSQTSGQASPRPTS